MPLFDWLIMKQTQRCGYIALIGRPNVGKSTLLNHLLGQKVSITSKKAQTTRHRILGINTAGDDQFVFVDTPGIHLNGKQEINKYMNKTAGSVIHDVDVVLFLVDSNKWKAEDEHVLEKLKSCQAPVILLVNKVDTIKDKARLLPLIKSLQEKHSFKAIIPLSAKTGDNVDSLEQQMGDLIPQGPHLFGEDQVTDRPVKFMMAEMVREKVFRLCGQELPYSVTVDIEKYEDSEKLVRIAALILVDKASHKRIIIGKEGEKLKEIGTSARIDMEKMLDKKVYLQLWIKVKSGWSDDARALKNLGYDDN